jgi:hypothetical protein
LYSSKADEFVNTLIDLLHFIVTLKSILPVTPVVGSVSTTLSLYSPVISGAVEKI